MTTLKWYFTADLHFNHPWMNKTFRGFCCQYKGTYELIRNWNKTVDRHSTVVILGDMFWSKWERWIWDALNGEKLMIKGNHDQWLKGRDTPVWWRDYYSKTITFGPKNKKHITCSHYAMRTWNRKQHGSWNLHGHSHGSLSPLVRQLDVGIDNAKVLLGEYRPFSIKEIHYLLEGKTI
jgi:calcineurin-like phosphoesterase family protein